MIPSLKYSFVTSCELGIFLVTVLIDIAPAICSVYPNGKGTVVLGSNRLRISFGQHSVELLVGGKSFDLDGVLEFSSVDIRNRTFQRKTKTS